jgi:DHA1 family inner membrane transport protein
MPGAEQHPAPKAGHRLILVLSLSGLFSVLNITLLSPMLKDIAAEFAVSDATAGQLSTLTAAAAFLTALIAAPLIGRRSLRFWLRLEVALVIVAAVLTTVAQSFTALLVARGLAGIGGAFIIGICFAAAAELVTDRHRRNQAVGVIFMSATLGVMVGLPLITLVIDGIGWRWGVALLIPFGVILLAGSGQLPGYAEATSGTGWRDWFTDYRRVLSHRGVLLLLGAIIVLFGVRFGWLIYFGAYAETVFTVSATTLSAAFVIGGLAQIVAARLVPSLMRNRPPRRVATWSAVVMAVNLAAVGTLYTDEWTMFLMILVGSFTYTACVLPLNVMLLDTLPSARGAVMSLQSAAMELGIAAGLALVGAALSTFDDYETSFRTLALAPPLIVVLLLLVARARPGELAPTTVVAGDSGPATAVTHPAAAEVKSALNG